MFKFWLSDLNVRLTIVVIFSSIPNSMFNLNIHMYMMARFEAETFAHMWLGISIEIHFP